VGSLFDTVTEPVGADGPSAAAAVTIDDVAAMTEEEAEALLLAELTDSESRA
jgi:hypothetical protein